MDTELMKRTAQSGGHSAERVCVGWVEPSPLTVPDRVLSVFFSCTLLLSSFLLFSIQPLAARILLPLVGGSSSLWTTAMLFFQTVLLVGYVSAHFSTRRLGRRQPIFQALVVLAPMLALPIALPLGWSLPTDAAPAVWVLMAMAVMVGLPFLALSTASPTLQSWFARTNHARAADPYFLYAAGNVGSVAALVAYPTVIERTLGLADQARWWAIGYGIFVFATLTAALLSRAGGQARGAAARVLDTEVVTRRRRMRWLILSATPSLLLLSVTTYITTDLASFPLFWVLPLLLYLVTHIIAFSGDSQRRIRITRQITLFGAVPLALATGLQSRLGPWPVVIALIWFFAAALFCHSLLAKDRPSPERLTEFYVVLSVGGAIGGVFASFVAPLLFTAVFEHPIGIATAMALASGGTAVGYGSVRVRHAATVGLAVATLAVVVGPSWAVLPAALAAALFGAIGYGKVGMLIVLVAVVASGTAILNSGDGVFRDRSFFGVMTVVERDGERSLVSGTTSHGSQLLVDGDMPEPTTYYYQAGPVGQVFAAHDHEQVGIVGLGTGAMAWYASPGDTFDLFEIDPLVVELAQDPHYFNYLSSSAAEQTVMIGDARQSLQRLDADYDILVIDAFSSDSVPTHLLTIEAFELYRERVVDDGIVFVHVSNRHFDLVPVLTRIASELDLEVRVQIWTPTAAQSVDGAQSTVWVALTERGQAGEWAAQFVSVDDDSGPLWTDDHADPLAVLNIWD